MELQAVARSKGLLGKWWHPALFVAFFFWLAVIFAVGGLAEAVFSDTLIAGPDAAVATPSAAGSGSVVVTETPVRLESDGLRIAWAAGSALVILGGGLAVLSLAQIAVAEPSQPIFSEGLRPWVTARSLLVAMLIGGGLGFRSLLEGRVLDAARIERVSVSDEDWSIWIFDVPWFFWLALLFLGAYVWERGARLQGDSDVTV